MKQYSAKSVSIVLILLSAATITATLMMPEIPNDPSYHHFADQRTLFGIPNALDVLSNFPLIILGALGMVHCFKIRGFDRKNTLSGLKIFFFAAVFLTGIGSSIYHWRPDNDSIVWDRLPLSIMFAAVFLVVLADRISLKIAQYLVWPVLIAGPAGVLYWRWSEMQNAGDLRFYGIVQLLPLLLIPTILILRPEGSMANRPLWMAFALYAFAKLAEFQDGHILEWTALFSGHTLKHTASGIAVLCLLQICRAPGKQISS